ncbi:alpha/beta fold hydrolase [Adhaeribacter soli]|uniref:Alpha/beta hydrolase n=1 Tax=Adhaeribacter soli TaxID=2607655 RepID=A0A5N1J5F6_9BACT|nr:alpha/beta hydrolase [Adhaeribacter soli]KAA9345920.1 alpha/beta hydrolase [Adhaeribacter soli]
MKKSILTFLLVLGSVFYLLQPVLGQKQPEKAVVYDAVLSQYAYPYLVKFMDLKLEGQACRMAYMDVAPKGKATGKTPVLLLHGKNFFGAYWRNTIKFLSDQGYRVIVPDQIGFGKSTKADLHYSFHLLAQNTKKLLDTLGVNKVVVVGHSMGGMVATRFTLMYPETAEKMVLENPIGLEDYRPAVPFQTLDETYANELKNSESAIRNYFKTYFPVWKPEYDEWVKVPAAQINGPDFKQVALASAETFEMIYQQPVSYEFPNVKAPSLLIIGQEDRTVVGKALIKDKQKLAQMGQYPQLGKKTAQAIPNAKLVEMPGIGHIPHLEVPDKFHDALLKFLKEK